MLISVKFRGEEHDVEVTDRRDYDAPEWMFFALSVAEHDALKITAAEEEAITQRVLEVLCDWARNSNPFDED